MKSKKRQKRKRTELRLIAVLVLGICLAVGYQRIKLEASYDKKEAKAQALDKSIAQQEQRSEELEKKKAYVQTKRFTEDVARQYLGLVYPEEVIIKPEE